MKKIFTYILLALLTLAPMSVSAKTIYFKPNSNWTEANAWFLAWTWGGSDAWMTVTDSDGDGVYECEVPNNNTTIKFLRKNPSNTSQDWADIWNRAADTTIPSNGNLYTINDGQWGDSGDGGTGATGKWSAPTATSVTLDRSSLTLEAGMGTTLSATVAPVYTFNKTITWTSSNSDVVTVNSNGEVHAVAAGDATITAKTTNGKTATCTVTVTAPAKKYVTSITFKSNPQSSLTKGYSRQWTDDKVTILPEDADDKSYTLSSDNKEIVTVSKSSEGYYYINAIAPGTTTIRVTANDGSGVYATSEIRVDDRLRTFTINFYTDWATPKVHFWGSATHTGTTWPGTALTKMEFPRGAKWWTYTFTNFEEAATYMFSHGEQTANTVGDNKTADLTVAANHTTGDYYMNTSGQLVLCTPPESVGLNQTSATVEIGKTVELTATVSPTTATDKSVTWTSDAEGIATVDADGIVHGIAAGSATITATTYNGHSKTCTVTVEKGAVAVSSITVTPATLTLTKGQTAASALTATVLPEDADNKTYTWSSDNKDVATVALDGKVTAVAPGTANIIATANDGSGKTGKCVVTVEAVKRTFTINLYTTWTTPKMYVWRGKVEGDYYEAWPGTALTSLSSTKGANWWSYKFTNIEETANVIINGTSGTSAVQTGDLLLSDFEEGDYFMKSDNTVVPFVHITDFTIESAVNLAPGATHTIIPTFTPKTPTLTDITWTSKNTAVATVSTTGVVTAKADGTAVITAKTKDGNIERTCTVTVATPATFVTSVTLNKSTLTLTKYDTSILTATVLPTNATNKTLTWTSSNTSVATVDGDGKVTAVGPGTATITAKSNDGSNKSATCAVTVNDKKHTFTINFYADMYSVAWATPKVYAWKSDQSPITAAWPGNLLTSAAKDKGEGWWTYTFTDIEEASGFILNYGVANTETTAGTHKTADLPVLNNHTTGDYYMVTEGSHIGELAAFKHVTGVTLNKTNLALNEYTKATLSATSITPADATVKELTWSSNNTEVATVDASTGEVTAVGEGTATITATVKGSKVSGSCTVNVTAATRVPIYFEISGTGWGENVEAHAYCQYYDQFILAEKLEIPHATTTWYKVEIPVITGEAIYVQAHKADAPITDPANFSTVIDGYTTATAYVIDKGLDSEGHHTIRVSDELGTSRRFIYTKVGDGETAQEYYSNRITENGTVSYFTSKDAATYTFCHGNDILGYTEVALSKQGSNGIYYATISGTNKPTPKAYTGNYYIRTDPAFGGWNDYKTNADNLMNYIEPQDGYVDADRYYWVRWVEKGNVKAALANDYNDNLAGEKGEYQLGDGVKKGANVRFGYNPETNVFTRSLMDGSGEGTDYLTIHATESNKIYTKEGDNYTSHDETNPVRFTDANDFIYTADLYVMPGTKGVITVKHHTEKRFMFEGLDENAKVLLSEENQLEGINNKHHIKVFYDFKNNRILSGWTPSAQITENKHVDRRICLSRTANDAPETPLLLADNVTLTATNAVVEMVINEGDIAAHGGYFWFSLPFECTIDPMILGIPATAKYGPVDNGLGDWCIQCYRGELRTQAGESESVYWRYLKSTATLQPNYGYVLQIKEYENIRYPLTIFFQSNGEVELSGSHDIEVEEHTLSPNSKNDHTNWNLIGSGALHNVTADEWTVGDKTKYGIQKYFYTWSWDSVNKKGVYALANAGETPMSPTHSYFVQYGGTIRMTPHTSTASGAPAKLLAPAAEDESAIYMMRMEVKSGTQADKTYIVLDNDATTAYDLNLDLGKIINSGMPQVYTLCAASKLAANNLPIAEDQTIAVGLVADKAGDYTFSLPRVTEGVTPVLYDLETGAIVNLALEDYTVALEAGTYETRFTVRLRKPSATTDCEQLTANGAFSITQVGNELLISGIAGEADIRLYDALGRELYHTTDANTAIPVFQTGVYLVSVNGAIERVLVR